MAYRPDTNGDLVISGWQSGIGASPESGLTDIRNIDITTIPGEAPIGFATSSQIPVLSNIAITGYSGSTFDVASGSAAGLTTGTAIYFPSLGTGPITGVSTSTPYWVVSTTLTTVTISSTYNTNTAVTFAGTVSGSPTFSTYTVGTTPSYASSTNVGGINWFAFDGTYYWGLDAVGQVWSNITPLGTAGITWSYTGNKIPGTAYTSGNGLVFYEGIDGHGWLFVFHNSSIDYIQTDSISSGWQYQWKPASGTVVGYSSTPPQTLNSAQGFTGSHMAIVGQDNAIYYCDSRWLGSIIPVGGQNFNPLSVTTTYTFNKQALALPALDNANCLAELGINLLVGGQRNLIYPWNRTATSFSYPIFLAESNVAKMQTVNTNTYIFCGNRGRIYITNGTQAQLTYKIPDHLSGTIEPYFFWGGVGFNRNDLYFGVYATDNSGNALATGNQAYGGVWAVNLDTGAMRLLNQLSYGSYAGYASAIISQVQPLTGLNGPFTKPAGTGLYIGWANATPGSGGTLYGIDASTTTPYTNGQAYIISDIIPIGTNLEPQTPQQFEFKLSAPLKTSESVQLYIAGNLTDMLGQTGTYTSVGTFNGDNTSLSYLWPCPLQKLQWLLVKIILTGISSSPSYNRLVEIRVKGITKKLTAYYNVPQ
jgi:hypothetical protein